jgi:integrase
MASGRRHNNEGSITKRPDGRWEARITLEGGKRKRFYGKTRQEVNRRLTEALRDRDRGLPIVGERQTVGQYLTTWLQAVGPTVGPTTLHSYEIKARVHLMPALGAIVLSKLSAQQVQAFYTAKLDGGLSSTTVHHLHSVLRHALSDAVRLGLVARNVTDVVDPPRMRHTEMRVYSAEEVRRFLEAARGHRLEALFVLAVTTGMRQGELLALRWRDVHFDEGYLQVRSSLKRIKGKLFIAETKTRRSRRRIALTPLACDALCRHRVGQWAERQRVEEAWCDNDLIFTNEVGNRIHLCGFNRDKFWPIIKRAGLPRVRFHDLRHTAATLLLSQGVNVKVVSEMLGHSSVSITLDVYGHVLPDMQRDATSAMQRMLGAESRGDESEGERR